MVAVEHRTTYQNVLIDEVPTSDWRPLECDSEFELAELVEFPATFKPRLGFEDKKYRNLAHGKPISDSISATAFLTTDPQEALPTIVLTSPPAVIGSDQQVHRAELRLSLIHI